MANTIRIKRSVLAPAPSSLAQGELGYVEQGGAGTGILYIGVAGPGIEVIGGQSYIDSLNNYDADLETFALPANTTISAFGATIVDDADADAVLTTLGVDTDITTLSLPASTTITAFAQTFLDDADGPAVRTTIGAGTGDGIVTSITGSTGITVGGTGAVPTVLIDYLGVSNYIDATPTDLEGTGIDVLDTIAYHDATDGNVKKGLVSDLPFGVGSGDISRVNITAGTGLTGTVDTVTGDHTQTIDAVGGTGILANADDLELDLSELPVTVPVTGDWIAFDDAGTSSKALISTLPLSIFSNDSGFLTAEADTLALVTGRAATTATASTFSGGVLLADSDLNRPVIEDYGVKHQVATVSTNAVTADLTLGNSVLIDMDPATAAVTLTLSNPPASGTYGEVTLHIVMGTPAYTMTWPGSVTWFNGGTAPTLTTVDNGVDTVHFYTIDGGTNWYGTYATRDAAAGGGTVTAVTGGTGIASTGGTTPDISLALDELSVTVPVTGDWLAFDDAGTSSKALFSATPLGIFDNSVSEFVSENDSIVVVDWQWVIDEDTMSSDSAVHVPTQQSVKKYVDDAVVGGVTYKGAYNASTNSPALDTGSPVLVIGDMYTVTVAGTFFTVAVEIGDVLIAEVDSVDAASVADWTIVQTNITTATETVQGYVEIATQVETDLTTSTLDTHAVTPMKLNAWVIDGGSF